MLRCAEWLRADTTRLVDLDVQLRASGMTKEEQEQFEQARTRGRRVRSHI
jgi:hypothetical protein